MCIMCNMQLHHIMILLHVFSLICDLHSLVYTATMDWSLHLEVSLTPEQTMNVYKLPGVKLSTRMLTKLVFFSAALNWTR